MAALRRLLLDPCGAGGSRQVAVRSFDLLRDRSVTPVFEAVAEDAMVVIDGSFLLKPEREDAWDVLIYLKASAAETRRRGIARDVGALGDEMLVTRLYDLRYEPAFVRYERECRPKERADLVIEHEDPAAPRLYR
jgi:uridine kinase